MTDRCADGALGLTAPGHARSDERGPSAIGWSRYPESRARLDAAIELMCSTAYERLLNSARLTLSLLESQAARILVEAAVAWADLLCPYQELLTIERYSRQLLAEDPEAFGPRDDRPG